MRERLAAAQDRVTEQADAARQRWRAVDAALATHERDRSSVGNVLAGAIAFRLFVYLLPLCLAVVTTLGILRGLNEDSTEEVSGRLGLSNYVLDSVSTAVRQSQRSLWILVPLTLWAVYTGGTGAAKVLRAVYAVAWERPVERLHQGWLAALVTFGFAVVMTGSVAGLQALRQESDGAGVVFLVVQLALLVGAWLLACWLLPHDPAAGWRDLLPGAALAGIGLWLIHLFSAYFLAHRVASASELYGSLGVAAALLAWLYLLGRLVVAAAMLNSTLWHRKHRKPPETTRGG